jgi:hypothetical protein
VPRSQPTIHAAARIPWNCSLSPAEVAELLDVLVGSARPWRPDDLHMVFVDADDWPDLLETLDVEAPYVDWVAVKKAGGFVALIVDAGDLARVVRRRVGVAIRVHDVNDLVENLIRLDGFTRFDASLSILADVQRGRTDRPTAVRRRRATSSA